MLLARHSLLRFKLKSDGEQKTNVQEFPHGNAPLGLIGSVIGGWMASEEPMTFTYYRNRHILAQRSM